MEYIVTILCVISGALIGTAAGIFLMFRRIRPAFTEVELSTLRSTLRAAEAAAAMTVERDDLRQRIAERERAMEAHAAELDDKRQQLALALAEVEKEAAKRAAAEQKIWELSSETAAFADERAASEAGFEEEKKRIAEEASGQAILLKAEGEADRRRIEELESEIGCVAAEYNELKAQFGGERERVRHLTEQVAALETERQSAARGIELLLMAQQNLSGFLKPLNGDPPQPSNGGATGGIAAAVANGL